MSKLTLEKFVEELKEISGENLLSVVLYGSAAAGDHAGKRSDYNLLVIAGHLDVPYLRKISKISVRWVQQGNPPPFLFTSDRFRTSADVFPVELMDIKENHQVLYGADPLMDLSVSGSNLRLELEHELKGKLIHLREQFLLTEGKPKPVERLMVRFLSTFLVLFKNVLRLYREKPPVKKMDALRELNGHIPFDFEVFQIADRMKRGEKVGGFDASALFERYLKSVESIVDAIDHLPAEKL